MPEALSYYAALMDLNEATFSQHLFLVAYHALCGSLYCAFHLQDKGKVWEVQKLATEQLQQIRTQHETDDPESESLEVTLYTSLTRIAHPSHMLGLQGRAPRFSEP